MEFLSFQIYRSNFPNKQVSQSSRGFIMILFISVLIIMITTFYSMTALFIFLKNKTKAQYLCYKKNAYIQNQLKTKLQSLISLNPKARILRFKRRKAEILFKAALVSTQVLAIKKAWIYLQKVKLQQKYIRVRQWRILSQSQIILNHQWVAFKNQTPPFMQGHLKNKHKALAVRSTPSSSASPSYKLIQPFSHHQKLTMEWKIPTALPHLSQKVIQRCSVSLEKIRNQFQIRLMD